MFYAWPNLWRESSKLRYLIYASEGVINVSTPLLHQFAFAGYEIHS